MQLNLKQFGESGPVLIILHGLLGSSQNWNTAGKSLGESFRVIVPDLRNHGDSPHGSHTIPEMSDDILELLETEKIERTIVLGHSMGGWTAMHLAFHHPQKLSGLIIEDIAPQTPLNRNDWILEAMARLDFEKVTRREDADTLLAANIKEVQVRQFLLQNLKRQEDDTFAWRCNVPELLHFVQNERFEAAGRYDGATLFIGGGKSEYRIDEKQELIVRHFPNSQLRMIPDAGHWLHYEATQTFVDFVKEYCRHASPDAGT